MFGKISSAKQLFILASVVLFALALNAAAAPADARFSSCSSDPILYLSDGSTLIVRVDIGTDVTSVKSVGYSIHTPHGVKLVNVVHTPFPGFAGKEQFAFNDDAKPGQYLTDTVVQTTYNKVNVTATSTLNTISKSVGGVNAQHLKATITR